jgi:hypothetical protein
MAHFAKIENAIVTQVIVVNNETINDLPFPESEPRGQEFIASLGLDGTWLECSYNNNFRGAYAGVGYSWDGTNFVAPVIEVGDNGITD